MKHEEIIKLLEELKKYEVSDDVFALPEMELTDFWEKEMVLFSDIKLIIEKLKQ